MQNQDFIALEKKLLDKEERLSAEKELLEKEEKAVSKQKDLYRKKLEEASGLTLDEARKELLKELEDYLSHEIARIIKERTNEAMQTADKKAQEILIDSMRHGALNYIAEYTVSIIKIQDEEIKGRIIGKEGRNIRVFEQATGVDVDLDEEGIIRISSFDQIRREIARRCLEKLIKDTRIQPFRIEEIVEQTKKEVEKVLFEEGQNLASEAGVYNIPPELLSILGRFKFRTSY